MVAAGSEVARAQDSPRFIKVGAARARRMIHVMGNNDRFSPQPSEQQWDKDGSRQMDDVGFAKQTPQRCETRSADHRERQSCIVKPVCACPGSYDDGVRRSLNEGAPRTAEPSSQTSRE